jgi:hypothetical protein
LLFLINLEINNLRAFFCEIKIRIFNFLIKVIVCLMRS